jgi:hypothetical protein
MDSREQVMHFASEIDNVVARFRREYDLTYCDMIGALHICAHGLCDDAYSAAPDEEDEDFEEEDLPNQ